MYDTATQGPSDPALCAWQASIHAPSVAKLLSLNAPGSKLVLQRTSYRFPAVSVKPVPFAAGHIGSKVEGVPDAVVEEVVDEVVDVDVEVGDAVDDEEVDAVVDDEE